MKMNDTINLIMMVINIKYYNKKNIQEYTNP